MTLEGKKLWVVVVLGVILVVLGGVWVVQSDQTPPARTYEIPATELSHAKGNLESNVVLTEFGDFQCPACASYAPLFQQLAQEFGDEVKFEYRHLPLRSIHRNADITARASVAAERQGKFWEMYDMLFARQADWQNMSNPKDTLIGYAQELGLNVEQFEGDMASEDTREKVNSDYDTAIDLGLSSTPTFILNNARIQPQNYDDFRAHLQRAIDTSNGAPADTTEAQPQE